MIRLIFASTKDSDMHYAVKTPVTGSFFYLESRGKKYALLDKVDFGLIPQKTRIIPVPLKPLAEEAKKLHFPPTLKLQRAGKTSDRNKLAYYILKKYGLLKKKIKVPTHFPLDMAEFLRKNGVKLVPAFPFFPERAVKAKEEIGFIKESLSRTKMAFRTIENILRRSEIRKNKLYYQNRVLTSEFLKQEAEKALVEKGMFDLLGMIVSSGAQTAIPHHIGSGPVKPHQPIVCDIFPRHRKSGYFSDMTRTYVKGKPSPELARMYAAVLAVQKDTFKKICSGIPAKNLQQNAAELFAQMGYAAGETGFVHGLGHGVGLDIHEKPSLKLNSKDVLREGHVITVEPGLYYPKEGLTRRSKVEAAGVRIEDMVLVTKTGCKNLTNYPKKFIIL